MCDIYEKYFSPEKRGWSLTIDGNQCYSNRLNIIINIVLLFIFSFCIFLSFNQIAFFSMHSNNYAVFIYFHLRLLYKMALN